MEELRKHKYEECHKCTKQDLGHNCRICGLPLDDHEQHFYKIVRFFRDDRDSEIIKTGLSLEAAQAHCSREDTHGDGWFDGYTEE